MRTFYGFEIIACVEPEHLRVGLKWRALVRDQRGGLLFEYASPKFFTLKGAREWARNQAEERALRARRGAKC